jgi:glutamate/tyrosine decarboxylase-like PLP-dependent enzyme
MKNYLDELTSTEWDRLGQAYAEDARNFFTDNKVFSYDQQQSNVSYIKGRKIPKKGLTFEEVRNEITEKVVPGSIHQHSKNYLAFPDKGSIVSSQYAAILNAALNQNVIAEDKSAPTGTYVEMTVIDWMRKLIGYKPDGASFPKSALELGGAFVTGGVLANTIALLGARQKMFPETKTKGLANLNCTPKVIVPGETMSHYSHFGSSWWLGFGTDNVIEAPCDSNARLDQEKLEKIIIESNARNEPVVAVVAVMGDSRTNTLEDLPGLYAVTQRHNVWLHVDACHGGILMFDQTFKHADKHILSYSDSLTFDPHKHFGVPYSGSVVLFKNEHDLANVGSNTDITIAYGSSDIGQVTPFIGSKGFDALKMYAAILQLGLDGIENYINTRRRLAKEWANKINQSKYFVAFHEPELFAVAFSIKPSASDTAEDITRKNTALHDVLYKAGDIVLHKFNIRDYRNALNFGQTQSVTGLGSFMGSDYYTDTDLDNLIIELERAYKENL